MNDELKNRIFICNNKTLVPMRSLYMTQDPSMLILWHYIQPQTSLYLQNNIVLKPTIASIWPTPRVGAILQNVGVCFIRKV